MIELFVMLAIFAICAFVAWLICAIVNAICEHKMLKKRLAHPKFYGWIAELDEMVSAEVKFHNTEISPLMREIDKIIAEMPYLTAEKQGEMLGVLEEYKETLADRKWRLKRMENERAKVSKRIREYNAEHKLEKGWAIES